MGPWWVYALVFAALVLLGGLAGGLVAYYQGKSDGRLAEKARQLEKVNSLNSQVRALKAQLGRRPWVAPAPAAVRPRFTTAVLQGQRTVATPRPDDDTRTDLPALPGYDAHPRGPLGAGLEGLPGDQAGSGELQAAPVPDLVS